LAKIQYSAQNAVEHLCVHTNQCCAGHTFHMGQHKTMFTHIPQNQMKFWK